MSSVPFDMNMAVEPTEEEIHLRLEWVDLEETSGGSRHSARQRRHL